jgi:hypothetical protein
MQSSVPRSAFEGQLGPPVMGKAFRASALYNATVVGFDAGNVTYRLDVRDGQEIPIPTLGLKVVHHVQGDTLMRSLAPLPGATFPIDPSPTGQTPLGLPAGNYRTRGLEGDRLVFDYSPLLSEFFGKAVRFTVTVDEVHAGVPKVVPGEYGLRSSPQLLGDPSPFLKPTS